MSKIIVSGLTKNYGNRKGIFDLNFTINQGEVFGYLGPKGAGLPIAFLLIQMIANSAKDLENFRYFTPFTLFNPLDIIKDDG